MGWERERERGRETNGHGGESVRDWMMVVAVVGMTIFRTSRQRTTSRSPRQRFSVGRWLKRRLSDKSALNSRALNFCCNRTRRRCRCFCNQLHCAIAIDFIACGATRGGRGNGKKYRREGEGGQGEKRNTGNRASGSGKLIRIIENVTNLFADCWLISRVPNVSNFSIFRATLRLSFHEVNN